MDTQQIKGPGGSNGPVAAMVELMMDEINTRELLARGLVARLPHGAARHRCTTELGDVSACRLALDAAVNDRPGLGATIYKACGDLSAAVAVVEGLIWRAFAGLAHQAAGLESVRTQRKAVEA